MPYKILFVDDEQPNREFVSQMVRRAGMEIDTAASGEEGLYLLESPQQRYDLMLCDISLPRMNGYEVVRKLRAGKSNNKSIPVVMTAAAFVKNEYDHEQAKSQLSGYIRHPLTYQGIVDIINSSLA